MTVVPAAQQTGGGGGTSGLYDVVELILDRGLVIDAFVRVSLVGIEILKIDVRVVVSSVDTYLRFAEAANRLDLEAGPHKSPGLPEIVGEITEAGSRGKSKGALSGAAQTISDAFKQAREEGDAEPRPRARRTTSGAQERGGAGVSTYVYGIAASSHPALPKDMGGVGDPARPVRILKEGELAAIVSDAPDGLRPKRKDLLAHQNVLSEAGAGGSVLPMRFGSVAPDDATVTGVLAERAEHYLERLRGLDGKVEYNIKATHDEEAVLRRVMADDPELRALAEANRQAGGGTHEQRLRLGERVAAAVQNLEAEDAVRLRHALEPAADAVSVGPESTGWLANVSFLVEREAAEIFLAAVEEVRKGNPHLELRVNGPLPPYSFVEPGPAEPAETEAQV